MPLSRMPSLSSLRAFEAAARRLSFKDAADELSVTPGAISQQVRSLEDDLGISLFHRATRSVSLTEAGLKLQPEVTDGFLKIRDAVDLVRPGQATSITVRAAGMVIRNWLLPRLHLFTEANRHLQTHVNTLHSWEDLQLGEDEVVFRLAKEPPAGVYSRKIHQLLLIPLASPDFIEKYNLKSSEDALRAPLLQDAIIQLFDKSSGWDKWFNLAGLTKPVPEYALKFDPYAADFALDMAINGKGVLLGWSIQCYQALSQGRLGCPFGPVMELDLSYYLVCHHSAAKKPHVKSFLDWAAQGAAILSTLKSLHLAAT
ncbi:MAG: LysR family transcriptional regulator [Pseudomonadota bacterium]